MPDKFFQSASGPDLAGALHSPSERVLWRGQCAVAEYAFDEPASLPRWTLPEETEVIVTDQRVLYRDPATMGTGELHWRWPQHLRLQPGNRETGRAATVTQIQLVCGGPADTFPALVFAGGDLTAVSDADRLANVLRQAIARYRVEHASGLGLPAPQARMLSRLVIGPEFSNYLGGDGQTVSLLGALQVQRQASGQPPAEAEMYAARSHAAAPPMPASAPPMSAPVSARPHAAPAAHHGSAPSPYADIPAPYPAAPLPYPAAVPVSPAASRPYAGYAPPFPTSAAPAPASASPYPTPSSASPYPTPSSASPYPTPSSASPYATPSSASSYPTPSSASPYPTPSSASPYATPSSASSYPTPSSASPYPTPSSASPYPTPSSASPYPTPSSAAPYPTPSSASPYPTHSPEPARPASTDDRWESGERRGREAEPPRPWETQADLAERAADLAARVAMLVSGGTDPSPPDGSEAEPANLSTYLDHPGDERPSGQQGAVGEWDGMSRAESVRRTATRLAGNAARSRNAQPPRADDEIGATTGGNHRR